MNIPSQAQYEANEQRAAQTHLRRIEEAPLSDRQDAAKKFFETMKHTPNLVGERLEWLFDGNYGFGPMMMAKKVLQNPRMNKESALTIMIAAFEWQAPQAMTIAAWKKLTTQEKAKLSDVIQKVIEHESSEGGAFPAKKKHRYKKV